ncbi:hypothetical protein LCGC14_1909190 [marine sediment metagenome]|uniref:Uncharacterized protein n=1 Tax=marine sediment metagenome TaxID=412755 RepID=A0A0F9FUP2_9ZZZZ
MKLTKMEYLKKELRTRIGKSISFIDVLERIYNKTRGQHNTAALVKAAKATKGLIVCHTAKWAEQLKEIEGVEATVYTDPRIMVFNGPIMIDMPCMYEFVKAHARLEKGATELLDFMDLKKVD